MKALTLSICLLYVVSACSPSGRSESTSVSNGKTSVTISENETTYELKASVERGRVMDVYRYINTSITPSSLFASKDDRLDVTTRLNDGTTFHIKAWRGDISLTFDKRANTTESYARIKELCEGVKKIVL